MTTAFKQRMVGAIFILSLGVILIPLILDSPQVDNLERDLVSHEIPRAPALPDVAEVSSIHYVFDEAATTGADVPPLATTQPTHDELVGPPAPIVPEEATILVSRSLPTPVLDSPVVAPSAGHRKASAHLAEAAQAASSQWTIQLGAFSSEKNANALVAKLSQGGFHPYLRAITQDSLVRVYVSPGVSREQALDLATKLDIEYGLKGIVVRYYQ